MNGAPGETTEHARLARADGTGPDAEDWRLWGPYLAGRQWGTVREDYSPDGDAWTYFPFDMAHRRAYRWGEDGIGGICDSHGFLNLSLALWNGRDDRLKERFFGLTNAQGNHGEDVKEYWWHLDATPTHSYAEMLYRYPQAAYPYADLLAESQARRSRGFGEEEYELADTGILEGDRFFDVVVRHAKAGPTDLVYQVSATNHGPDPAPLDLVPQLWFRNTWSWGRDSRKPYIVTERDSLRVHHGFLGGYRLTWESELGSPRVLRCDNDTNTVHAFGSATLASPHPTDAIDTAIVHGDASLLTPESAVATKAALHWHVDAVASGQTVTVTLRLRLERPGDHGGTPAATGTSATPAADVLSARRAEADAFYADVIPAHVGEEDRLTARRAFAGLLWCKQHFRYDVRAWLEGDPTQPPPPPQRLEKQPQGRNTDWTHLSLKDVISMPDEWEYPWFASWDLAFHTVTMAHVDPAFAKEQLLLMCREWAMHPNGQLPAYEWNFSDVNPPVHAWAAWQVYQLDGGRDRSFLLRVFLKLLLNFGWWTNRKDADDSFIFDGGFLGMDNIGLFDRSDPLPDGLRLEQSDATSWMAFFSLGMLEIAWELARGDVAYNGVAVKFLEHFLLISQAMTSAGRPELPGWKVTELWNEQDGFYYDAIVAPDGSTTQLPVRTMVGLLPIIAVAVQPPWVDGELREFEARLARIELSQPELAAAMVTRGSTTMLSMLDDQRLSRLLSRLLDDGEFLSPYGVRAVSAEYRTPYTMSVAGVERTMTYTPGESDSGLFGGNSNWRGPVWFPVNVLLTDALRSHAARGLAVELPTGSGRRMPLDQVADALEERLVSLFRVQESGRRPSDPRHVPTGPLWQAHPTFSEYFHGDEGRGIGASHQTGWTAIVAHLICMTTPHAG